MSGSTHRPAVFVDRDQTLIEDPGYVSDPDRVRLLDGAAQAVARLRAACYPVVVVTNQSGVARGLITEEQLAAVHQRMQDLLRAEGTGVDAIYYCPFLDDPEVVHEAYRRDSDLRKPRPGMLLLAAREMNLDLQASWMIGDSERDVEAGRAAGCRTILIDRNGKAGRLSADHVTVDLPAAVEHILAQTAAERSGGAPERDSQTSVEPSDDVATGPTDDTADEPTREPTRGADSKPAIEPTRGADSEPARERAGEPTRERAIEPIREPAGPPADLSAPQGAQPGAGRRKPTEGGGDRAVLGEILEELRMIRREQQHEDFSIGKLAGAVAQAFALCSVAWGLYAWMNSDADTATIQLLAGIAFQVMALTFFTAATRR